MDAVVQPWGSVIMPATVSVFLSYARLDDKATYGRISNFKTDIQHSYEALTGDRVEVFQDVDSIGLGEQWRDRIRAGLSASSILLAFISPAFLRSAACREELRDFLGFLAGPSTQGLIIPLVFGDTNMIEAAFGGDELWLEVRSRQCLEVPDLRTADQGTERWLRNVERVAARVAEVLGTAASNKAATEIDPASTYTGRQESTQRAQVTLTEWSVYAPRIQATLGEYNELVPRLGGVFLAEGPTLRGAQTFGQKMAAANRLASDLSSFVGESHTIASRLRADVVANDEGVRHIFRQLRKGALRAASAPIVDFVTQVRTVAELGMTSLLSASESVEAMENVRGFAQPVDVLLTELTTTFLIFTELRGAFRGWLEEVAILDNL